MHGRTTRPVSLIYPIVVDNVIFLAAYGPDVITMMIPAGTFGNKAGSIMINAEISGHLHWEGYILFPENGAENAWPGLDVRGTGRADG